MTTSVLENQFDLIRQAYEEFRPELVGYLRCRLGDEMLAEDLAQDTFLRLLEMENAILPNTVRALVFTTARNLLFDHLRRKQKQKEIWQKLEESAATYATTTEQVVTANALAEAELHIVSQLPERRRKVYELARFNEKTTEEIALALGMSKRTADTHLFLGRRDVRNYLIACGF